MSVTRLSTLDDHRVAVYRDVSHPELIREQGLFVVEGQLAVERLLSSRFTVRSLLLTDAAHERLGGPIAAAGADLDVLLTDSTHLRELTGFRFHRGCLALGVRGAAPSSTPAADPSRPLVALEAVADPDNVGSIFRSAAAFGAAGVVLSPHCADPLYRKAIRTSMGTTLQLPFAIVDDWPSGLAERRPPGTQVVALTPAADAIELEGFLGSSDTSRPTVLLFGNEGAGVSPEALELADACVRIAIDASAVDSLNVATSAAIVLQRYAALARIQ